MSTIQLRVFFVLLTGVLLLPNELVAAGELLFRTRDPDLGYFFEVRDDPKEGGDQLFITKGRAARSETPIFTSPVNIGAAFLSSDKRFLVVTHYSAAYGTVSDVFRFNEEDGSIKPHLPESEYRGLLWKTLLKKHPSFAEGYPLHTYAGIRSIAGNKAYVRMRGDYYVDEGPNKGQHYYDPVFIAIDLDALTAELVAEENVPKYWHRGSAKGGADSGSGFWVSCRCVLTNEHVVRGAKLVLVATEDRECEGIVVATDVENDLALIEVPENALSGPPLTFRAEDIPLGLDVRAFGFPLPELQGYTVKLTTGTISGLYGLADDPNSLQMTAAIQPGNSGGPVVDADGSVVGVAVSALNKIKLAKLGVATENTNFCIHRDVAAEFVRRHRPEAAALVPSETPNPNVHSSVVQIMVIGTEVEPPKPAQTTVSTSLPAQTEVPSPTVSPEDSKKAMELAMISFAAAYINSGNGGTAEGEASFYADRCDYFDNGVRSKAQILADIRKYRNRWPHRKYTFTNFREFEIWENPSRAGIIVDFNYEVSNGAKRASGVGSTAIVCENVLGQPQIVLIRTAVKSNKKRR